VSLKIILACVVGGWGGVEDFTLWMVMVIRYFMVIHFIINRPTSANLCFCSIFEHVTVDEGDAAVAAPPSFNMTA